MESTTMLHARFITCGFLFLAVAIVGGTAPGIQAVSAVPEAEEAAIAATIKKLSAEWSAAYLKNDPSILERIWAPDFVYVEP